MNFLSQALLLLFFANLNCFALKNISYSCSPFKGEYKLQAKGKVLNLSGVLYQKCKGKIKFIEIFALDKIWIDEDIIKIGEEMQINIFAPVWEVISNRIINLDGTNATNTWKPEERRCDDSGKSVMDGVPGLPGGIGGSFFGVMSKSINGRNLKISSNGGDGSDGQYACNGFSDKNKTILPGNGGRRGLGASHGLVKLVSLKNDRIDVRSIAKNGTDGNIGKKGETLFHVYTEGRFEWKNSEETEYLKEQANITHDFFSILGGFENLTYYGKENFNTKGYKYPKKADVLEDFTKGALRYRSYVLETVLNTSSSEYLPLYYQINNNKQLMNKSLIDYIEELSYWETLSSTFSNKAILLSVFKELEQEFHKYQRKESEKNDDYTQLISTLKSLVILKIVRLEDNSYDWSILHMESYLNGFIESSTTLQQVNSLKKLEEIGSEFKSEFDNQIKEANKLINEDLKTYLNNSIDKLHSDIDKLMEEVADLIKAKKHEVEVLKEKKKELQNKIILRAIFTSFQILFLALSFINPAFAIAGALLTIGASTLESSLLDSNNASTSKTIQLPAGVRNTMKETFDNYDKSKKSAIELVDKKLEEIKKQKEDYLAEEGEPLTNVEKKVTALSVDLKKNQTSDGVGSLRNILQDEEDKWNEKKQKLTIKNEKQLKYIKRANNAVKAVELGVEYTNKILNDVAQKEQIDVLIENSLKEVKQLEEYKNKMQKFLGPKIEQIRKDISIKEEQFAVSSFTFLQFQSWQMGEYFADVSKQMDTLTEKFKAHDSIRETMDKLKRAIGAIIDLHKLIKKNLEEKRKADFLQDMFSLSYKLTDINSKELNQPLTKLMHIYYTNNVLDEYEQLKTAILQLTFPHIYKFRDVMLNETFEDRGRLAIRAFDKIKSFNEIYKKYKKNGNLIPGMASGRFGSGKLDAFYIWNSSVYKRQVKEILEGKEVELTSFIFSDRLNAVKFKDVDILITSFDPEMNEELQNELKNFKFRLTHKGDSYYRCDNKYYLIKSGAYQFRSKEFMSTEKCPDAKEEMDFVLSPYATWSILLMGTNQTVENSFEPLAKFVDKVQIELVGDGKYLESSNLDVCENDFSFFYGKSLF